MHSSPLAGRTVVVTGAARGLGAAMAREIARRGGRVALPGHEKTALDAVAASLPDLAAAGERPPWLGDEAFHDSHRSALVRKEPEVYAALFPGLPDDLPYVWPAADRDPQHAPTGR